MENATWISKYLSAIREPFQFDSVGHRCLLGLVQTMDLCLFSFLLSLSLSFSFQFWSAESAPRFVQLCEPSVKGQRWKDGGREGERGRARHNKYNGWASSWRESPGDFAGFCNWNASRGGGKQGTRRINAIPLLYFATPSSQVEERQLNGMSKAILVPFLVPFVSSVSFLSFLSPSILFFFFLFYSFHLPSAFSLLSISIHSRSRWYLWRDTLLYSHIVRTRFLGKSLNVDVGSGFWLDQDRKRVNGSGVASLWIYI